MNRFVIVAAIFFCLSLAGDAYANKFHVEIIVEGLESPWAVVPLGENKFLITERPGRLKILKNGKLSPPLSGVPKVSYEGQGGLMDVVPHPDFSVNHWIYLSYSLEEKGVYNVYVVRYTLSKDRLTGRKVIFKTDDGNDDGNHFGSRLAFDKNNRLYITLGERHDSKKAQSLNHYNGKVLRLNDDGSIPADNPFTGKEGTKAEIFSYGHRNPQGIDIHPENGMIVSSEHGPSGYDAPEGGDEVNIIRAGHNYGWPVIHHKKEKAGMESPSLEFTPAIAPSGATFYSGDKFPEWKNNFFFATLRGKALYRVKFNKEKIEEVEEMLKEQYGRLRDVTMGLDGYLYILTSDTDAYGPGRERGDRLLRLSPN